MRVIEEYVHKLGKNHKLHIELYGDNSKRLTGEHETSSIDKFSYGIGDRSVSVRIPLMVATKGKGHLEDRRPASDIDFYVGCAVVADTCLLKDSLIQQLYQHFKKWKEWRKQHDEITI
jgi:glutamine synthetase